MNASTPPEPPQLALDDTVLRELATEQAPATADGDAADDAVRTLRPQFTGDGGEYFRIWVVNLLLTLLTLGIYSAWAKVRKTRYFWQNTRLDGHVFDFHGRPAAILRGRILALALVAAYSWSFEISLVAGVVTVLLLCLLGPWLFTRALQFRLRNTSHRGLRFDFDAGAATSYGALLPLLVIWFSGTLGGVLLTEQVVLLAVLGVGTAVLFPWMHHRLKAFQHSHARYASLRSAFLPTTGRFYAVYVKAMLVMMLGVGIAMGAGIGVVAGVGGLAAGVDRDAAWLGNAAGVSIGGFMVLVYLAVWAYFAVRVQQVVWRNTSLGELRFDTHVRAREYGGLVLRCLFLTLVTLGLYWPYAAVRLARYRVQCMEVRHLGPPELLSAGIRRPSGSAAGEGAADLFGLDVGL